MINAYGVAYDNKIDDFCLLDLQKRKPLLFEKVVTALWNKYKNNEKGNDKNCSLDQFKGWLFGTNDGKECLTMHVCCLTKSSVEEYVDNIVKNYENLSGLQIFGYSAYNSEDQDFCQCFENAVELYKSSALKHGVVVNENSDSIKEINKSVFVDHKFDEDNDEKNDFSNRISNILNARVDALICKIKNEQLLKDDNEFSVFDILNNSQAKDIIFANFVFKDNIVDMVEKK